MVTLFYFSHLFEVFIASDDNVGDQKILKGEFIRAKDKLLCQPGIRIKKKIPLDAWEAEFEKMDSGVRKNEYVSFHEFCQYAVKELTTPEKYLADYKKDDFVVRPQYPPLYDDGINYQKSLLKHKRLARAQTSVTLPTDVHIAKRLESLRPEASFFNNKAELENASSTLLHERDKELLSPSESLDITDTISNCSKQTHEPNQFPTPITDVELIASREKQAPIISMSQEVDLELSSPREIQENSMVVDYSHITDEKDRSVSILLASRGRIRPFSAPPPRAPKCSPAPKPDCKLLQPTVFNGRHILSVKKAKKKKYNIFHQYKLDRDAESNCTPRKYVPQKKILKNELPKKPLSPTTHRIATAADGGLSFCSSIHSHATLRVHFPSIYVDEKASPCSSSHVDRRLSCDSKIDDGDECSIHDSISEKDNPEENSIVKPNYDEIPTYKEPDHTLLDFLISLNYCG